MNDRVGDRIEIMNVHSRKKRVQKIKKILFSNE